MSDRISKATKWLMLSVAILYELLSIIPFVNWVIWVLTPLTFGPWFWLRGAGKVGFINTKKLKGDIFIYIIELIPLLSIFPGITLRIYRTIRTVQHEDLAKKSSSVDTKEIRRQRRLRRRKENRQMSISRYQNKPKYSSQNSNKKAA